MKPHIYIQMAAMETRRWWFVGRRRILTEVLTTHADLPSTCEILEVGCGTGGNLSMLSQFGRVCAIEPNDEGRGLARQKGDFEIRKGSLPHDIPFDAQTFDLISALDILEHVPEDQSSLHSLRNFLRPKGWLLITVPPFSFLWSSHDEDHYHKRRYNKTQLLRIVQNAGFSPVMVTYFNTLMFPLAVSIRLMKKILRLNELNEQMTLPEPINALLTRLFSTERYFLKNWPLPVGLSLLLLARKSS